ncbi:MYLK, partial [Symbiodinium necroappetens]
GSQIFCGVQCFMKFVSKPSAAAARATSTPTPEPDPEKAPTLQAEILPTPAPPACDKATEPVDPEPKAGNSSPPTPVATATVTAGLASARAEASGGGVFAAASCTEANAKAWVNSEPNSKTEKKQGDDLEQQLEKLIDDHEQLEQATNRAHDAEMKAKAMQHLLQALLASPPDQHEARAQMIESMLRRPATCDIEALTEQLTAGTAAKAGAPTPSPAAHPAAASVPAADQNDVEMPQKPTDPEPTATATASVPVADVPQTTETAKPTETPEPTAAAKASVPAADVPQTTEAAKPTETPEPTAAAKASVPAADVPQTTEAAKPTETPEPTASVPAAHVPQTTEAAKPTETPKPTATPAASAIHVKQESGTEPDQVPTESARKPQNKPDRANESEEDRKAREAHNSYMRYFRSPNCPPEVRAKALTQAGKSRSTSIMRHMYEMWISSGCDWMQSSIVMNAKKRHQAKRHGTAIAEDIRTNKKAMDPNASGKWWKVHPDQPKNEDWELFKCFDSREEVSQSEDELEFGAHIDASLDHAGTTGVLSHLLDVPNSAGARGSNDPPPPGGENLPPPREVKPKKEKKVKNPEEEALDLLRKGTPRIIEADGMDSMLRRNGMGDAFAKAMVADMANDIEQMKDRHTALQSAVTTKRDEAEIETLNTLLKASFAVYDEKMKAVKRTLRPAPKAKGKAKAKAAA